MQTVPIKVTNALQRVYLEIDSQLIFTKFSSSRLFSILQLVFFQLIFLTFCMLLAWFVHVAYRIFRKN